VIGFVSGSGYIDKPTMDSLRKSLAKEFTSIYVLNLRGDIRKNMLSNGRAQEGENIFGNGSMTGIAVTLFIKNPNAIGPCKIYYHDIGNNRTIKEKLTALKYFGSIGGITREQNWQIITPNGHGDWINQRDENFKAFLALGDKKNNDKKLFAMFSRGIMTSRDAWAYNSSREVLKKNMNNMITFYNSEVERFNDTAPRNDSKTRTKVINSFVNSDESKISWSYNLKKDLVKGKFFNFKENCLTKSLYRPFTRQWLYNDSALNCDGAYQMRIFPIGETAENKVIQITG
ncbi:type ISP restriction/modification enzyme, partial [Bartonella rattimassiliensis]